MFNVQDLFKEIKFKIRTFVYRNFNSSFDSTENVFTFSYEDQSYKITIPDVHDFISFQILKKRTFFDVTDLERTREYIPAGSVVIDAGANIGSHSIYYAKVCKASKVLSFEPQKEIFSLLKKNIKINQIEDIVIPYELALGNTITRATIDFRDDHALTSKTKQINHGGVYLKEDRAGNFQVTTLDDLFLDSLDRLDFIKMDIQGFEEKAVRGGYKLIKKFMPIVQLECTSKKEYITVLLPLMRELGYETRDIIHIDYIFCPRSRATPFDLLPVN